MSHEIDMSKSKRGAMAYAGKTPWHNLGHEIDAGASIEVWRKAAGLDYEYLRGELMMKPKTGKPVSVGKELNRSVLYRSDTGAPLSVMSNGFKIVQPDEILDFIGSSVKAMGWKMETAGALHGGRKIWALANLGEEATLVGGDRIKGYLLAATSCDGTLASDFRFTSVRVVCNNTLTMATRGADSKAAGRVKVYHFQDFDPKAVKKQLGIATEIWADFIEQAKRLTEIKLSQKQAAKILRKVYEKPTEKVIVGDEIITDEKYVAGSIAAKKVMELFDGRGIGMDLRSAKGTAWGLVNATTEFYDHASNTRSTDNRLHSAWYGIGATKKQEVVDACFEMAA